MEQAGVHGSRQAREALYRNASLVAEGLGQLSLAADLAERAVTLLTEAGGDLSLARLRAALAWMLLRATPPGTERAERLLLQSHEIVSRRGAERETARCETHLAIVRLLQVAQAQVKRD